MAKSVCPIRKEVKGGKVEKTRRGGKRKREGGARNEGPHFSQAGLAARNTEGAKGGRWDGGEAIGR